MTRYLPRLLESYREFQSPSSRKAIERHKGSSTAKTHVPVTFPESYPFSMVSYLPEGSKGTSLSADDDLTFYPGVGETAVVLLVLILSSPRKHIQDFLESCLDIEGRERFIAFLSQFFKVSTSILENDAFPKTWLNINILAHKVLIKMMDPVAAILEKEFLPSPASSDVQFNPTLWRDAFHMLLKLLSSEQLVIEEFSPQVSAWLLILRDNVDVKIYTETTCCLASGRKYTRRGCYHNAQIMERPCAECKYRGARRFDRPLWGTSSLEYFPPYRPYTILGLPNIFESSGWPCRALVSQPSRQTQKQCRSDLVQHDCRRVPTGPSFR